MIRILSAIGGSPAFDVGAVVSLTPEVERAWILDGLAEPVDDEVETAMLAGAHEKAVRRRGRPRKADRP